MSRLDSLLKLIEREGVELVDCKGWVQVIEYNTKVREVALEDSKTKLFVGLLASEFKRIFALYPQLKESMSVELLQLYEGNVF